MAAESIIQKLSMDFAIRIVKFVKFHQQTFSRLSIVHASMTLPSAYRKRSISFSLSKKRYISFLNNFYAQEPVSVPI